MAIQPYSPPNGRLHTITTTNTISSTTVLSFPPLLSVVPFPSPRNPRSIR